jgi:hypothetical protein
MAAPFDTLRAARRLKEAGAAEPVAETIGDARELDLAQLATRADLALLRGDLMALRSDLEAKIAVAELRLIRWVIGVGVAAVLALTGVIWTATQLLLHAH